ncbi:hypothetical protein PVAND_006019 [Polypedilum vanderplanki]|uniref:CHK kinase-like domain-containing protein n=1 Tax=Polypedilum vanderplanki TaxID=319348 RepID=A0A9J6C2C1_POLVA|nr:hypothetical protein PVAND_006019 [Polypedilum vanderplanki]
MTEVAVPIQEITPIVNGHEEISPITNGTATAIELPMAKQSEIVVTDYIRQSLDKVAIAEGFKNYTIDVDHGSSIGDGFIGIILKVTIQEHDSDHKLIVLAKIPPPNKARREAMGSMKFFEREIFIYNVMLPEFVEFQKEKKIPESMGFFNFPKVYFAEINEELDESIIIMEDLRQKDYKMWSKFDPVNYEHTKHIMTALGRLHALSFAMKAKKPELFEKYKKINDYFLDSFQDNNFKTFLEQSVVTASNSLDIADEKKKAKVLKLNENLFELLATCLDKETTEPFAVMNHGDCWVNNFLFHYTKRGVPDKIVLIDWQISRYCSPVIDLIYFFFICTDQQLRLKHFDEFLRIYHHSLKELLDHLGGDTMTQFPFTALLRHLKRFAKFGVVMAAMAVPMLQTKKEDIIDMDFMAEQMKEADPAVMEEIMRQYKEKGAENNASNNRMRGVLQDALRNGYL